MKRKLSLLISFSLIMMLLASCAQATNTPGTSSNGTTPTSQNATTNVSAPVKLVWFTEQQDDEELARTMTYMVNPFQAANPNIKIEVAPTADYDQVLKIQLSSGGGPDLVNMGGPSITSEFVSGNKLVDLTSYVTTSGLDKKIFSWALDSCKINGKIYSIPNSYEALLLWYNKDMFIANGWKVPTTYAELEKVCNAAQGKSLTPIAFGTSDFKAINEQFVSVALASYAGRDNVKKALQGNIKWTDPLIKGSIDILNNMWQKGWINDKKSQAITSDDANALFYSKKAPMIMTGTWMLGTFMTQIKDFEYGAVLFPSLRDGVPPTLPLGAGGVYGINATSKYPAECFKVIQFWFENVETHAKAVAAGSQPFPINVPAAAYPSTMNPITKGILTLLQDGQSNLQSTGHVMWTYWPAETRLYMMDNIEKVYLGSLTVDQYLTETQKIFEGELAKGGLPVVP